MPNNQNPEPEKVSNPAVNIAKVLQDESREVQELWKRRLPEDLHPSCSSDDKNPELLGVAFSGGGIRSAAVNLGLIQALAKCKVLEPGPGAETNTRKKDVKDDLLRHVHYLSGISGGGYILGWLTAWISRFGFNRVQKELATNSQTVSASGATTTSYHRFLEPQPLRNLRQYASFLTPRVGFFSGDTLALIAIYLRNLLLNQALMVAAVAGLIALAQMLAPSIFWAKLLPDWLFVTLVFIALAAPLLAGAWIGRCLGCLARNERPEEPRGGSLIARILALLATAAVWLLLPTALVRFSRGPLLEVAAGVIFASGLTGLVAARWFGTPTALDPVRTKFLKIPIVGFAGVASSLVAGAFFALLIYAFAKWLVSGDGTSVLVGGDYAAFGLPANLLAFSLSSYIYIGIYGDSFPDAKREWLGRLAGYFLYFGLIAAVVLIIAFWGPLAMQWVFQTGHTWLKWILPGGWLFTVLSGVLAAKSPSTGDPGNKNYLNILVKVAPPVFLIGVLLLVSWGVHGIVRLDHEVTSASLGDQLRGGFLSQDAVKHGSFPEYLDSADWPEVPGCTNGCSTPTHKFVFYPCLSSHNSADTDPFWKVSCGLPSLEGLSQPAQSQPSPNTVNSDAFKALGKTFLVCIIVTALLLVRLDVNEFSMHLLYRNRLVRAFLGASNSTRKSSPFTGFGLDDDVPLQDLCLHSPKLATNNDPDWKDGYDGPYPLWGTALNLTSGEVALAWQKRKAASFLYSPLYCGWDFVPETTSGDKPQKSDLAEKPKADESPDYDSHCSSPHKNLCKYGYRGTGKYAQDGTERTPYTGAGWGPLIGTALAASGAAISPNWGYHSSPAVAALLALFNIRIGWWTGNPRHNNGWKKYAPRPYYLLYEVAGSIGDDDRFVYLSDGGHFENLGVYELVRRRMKFIIACDADADPDYTFEDLGNAIEKCRRDFGVEIEMKNIFDMSPAKSAAAESQGKISITGKTTSSWELALKKPDFSRSHSAVGLITYPPLKDGGEEMKGVLLYIKSSLTGDEEPDVLSQHLANPVFPHDTTLNQFFNETQFEGYRALGQHMFQSIWKQFLESPEGKAFPAGATPEEQARQRIRQFFKDLAQPLFAGSANGI